jgi:hypothetical protein
MSSSEDETNENEELSNQEENTEENYEEVCLAQQFNFFYLCFDLSI